MASTDSEDTGRRLLPTQIDHLAHHSPQKVWATIPLHPGNVSIGYRDISFKQLANAINHAAHWMSKKLSAEAFETITYNGPYDIQFPILAAAAVKCSKRLLLCSPWITPAQQTYLLKESKCTTYLHSAYFTERVKGLLTASPEIRPLEVPKLNDWLSTEEAPAFPYEKTWDEAANDPWMIFHTSGTTGQPKMIVYTNAMMTSFDAAKLMPDASDERTINQRFKGQRFFAPAPPTHFTGMIAALQWPIFLDNVFVAGPSAGPITPQQAVQVLKLGKVGGMLVTPSVIEDISREPNGLETLRNLEWICYVGAPMPPHIAMELKDHCLLMPGMGSTEAGTYWTTVSDDEEDKDNSWDSYVFRTSNGIEMEPRGGDLYELVFHRKPELERWQMVFKAYPHLDRFATKDLWTRHPSGRPDAWCFAGRLDDIVVLGYGHKINATELQHVVQAAPGVRGVLIGGQGHVKPCMIVDLVDQGSSSSSSSGSSSPSSSPPLSDAEREARLDEIWPYVEQANEKCPEKVHFTRDLVLFSHPEKPLPMTFKGTPIRSRSLDLYAVEIDQLYARYESREKETQEQQQQEEDVAVAAVAAVDVLPLDDAAKPVMTSTVTPITELL